MEDCKEKEQSLDCSSVSIGFVADRCVKMSVEYNDFKPLPKAVFLSDYANKAMT